MTDPATERWLPVIGYEGLYEVSDLGRVRSLDRAVASRWGPSSKPVPGCILASAERNEYLQVKLHRGGTERTHHIHRLVGEAFIGPLPPGLETRHGPGGKLDNRLVNLCYGTHSENQRDRKRDGTARVPPTERIRGEAHHNARFTETDIRDMRQRYAAGETRRSLALRYETSYSAVDRIVKRRSWRHVT